MVLGPSASVVQWTFARIRTAIQGGDQDRGGAMLYDVGGMAGKLACYRRYQQAAEEIRDKIVDDLTRAGWRPNALSRNETNLPPYLTTIEVGLQQASAAASQPFLWGTSSDAAWIMRCALEATTVALSRAPRFSHDDASQRAVSRANQLLLSTTKGPAFRKLAEAFYVAPTASSADRQPQFYQATPASSRVHNDSTDEPSTQLMEQMLKKIRMAVHGSDTELGGARLYDRGGKEGKQACYRRYRATAEALLELADAPNVDQVGDTHPPYVRTLAEGLKLGAQAATDDTLWGSSRDAAWSLRRTLEATVVALSRCPGFPEAAEGQKAGAIAFFNRINDQQSRQLRAIAESTSASRIAAVSTLRAPSRSAQPVELPQLAVVQSGFILPTLSATLGRAPAVADADGSNVERSIDAVSNPPPEYRASAQATGEVIITMGTATTLATAPSTAPPPYDWIPSAIASHSSGIASEDGLASTVQSIVPGPSAPPLPTALLALALDGGERPASQPLSTTGSPAMVSTIGSRRVVLEEVIGRGTFGAVYIGRLDSSDVAVKVVPSKPGQEAVSIAAANEVAAALRKVAPHPNLATMFGAWMEGTDFMLTSELCDMSLTAFLSQDGGNIDDRTKLDVCRSIAAGMQHLHLSGLLHGNVAARNVMVKHEGPERRRRTTFKVADFLIVGYLGIINGTGSMELSHSWRWAAPEVLQSGTTVLASDVWSFGVTVWETYTNASAAPFSELRQRNLLRDHLISGKRVLGQPLLCPDQIWGVAESCFARQAAARPTFDQLLGKLSAITMP